MTMIIKDGKFLKTDPLGVSFTALAEANADGSIDLASDTDPRAIIERLGNAPAIRINFPTSHDGRGFSIASALRRSGYRGHLRAHGHVLADQYPLALRSGFNDVEISSELAERQPETQWVDALTRTKTSYRERLMNGSSRAA